MYIEVDMCSQFYLLLLIFVHITTISTGGFFLVTPGDGEEFVYSPVNVSATLNCAVNNMYLVWTVDTLTFSSDLHRDSLHSRDIFQSEPVTSSDGVKASILTVFGNLAENNNSRICCQSQELEESCTMLIIYDRPSTPELMTPQYNEPTIEINITWTAIRLIGVDQNYTIYFDSQTVVTTQLFYIYQQNTSDSKIRCNVFITAVNGAGESDPSNNVTIPSLPDIGPVTASLSHQVWKSTGGEIMANISFEPALYCVNYLVLEYVLKLRSEQTGSVIKTSLGSNETDTVLKPQDGLKGNQKYVYTVIAVNIIGNTTTPLDGKFFLTSDVQSVTATVVGESTIDIQCLFIYGSDTVGCKVVLASDHPSVNNETSILLRRHISASAQLNLTHKVACYHQVLAYTIDGNNITSTFFIKEKLSFDSYNVCSVTGDTHSSLIAIIMSIIITILTLLVVAIFVIALSVFILKKKKECWKKKSRDDTKSNCYISSDSKYQTYKTKELGTLSQNPAPLLRKSHSDQNPQKISQSPQSHSPPKTPHTSVPYSHDQSLFTDANTYPSETPLVGMPLYAVPEKIKMTEKGQIDKEESGNPEGKINNEENFYHVLENDKSPSKCEVTSLVSPTPELSPPMETHSNTSLLPQTTPQKSASSMPLICDEFRNKVANNDVEGHDSTEAMAVPLYAVPDKVRSKNKSVLSQSSCVSAVQEESDELKNVMNKETQEHLYHVLENDRAPNKSRTIPPDSNAPELPPPFISPSEPPPVYQDINDIDTKTN